MSEPGCNELKTKLEWSQLRVTQLETERESWRNKALLLQMKVKGLEAENLQLRERLARSLPLYDPDEFTAPKGPSSSERDPEDQQ